MLLTFDHVSKTYGKTEALKDVSFTVDKGEFVFLVGHSGAGKSTILRLLLRDIIPSSGTIKVDDLELAKLTKHQIPHLRRSMGVIFQDFKILFDRTVGENVSIALEITEKKRR